MSQNPKPFLFVLIHGAWQNKQCWQHITPLLNQRGYQTLAIDLPGHGENKTDSFTKITLTTYINAIVKALSAYQHQYRIILVGHSMAGMIIRQVAQELPIEALIYLAAFMPVSGESLIDVAQHNLEKGLSEYLIFQNEEKKIALQREGLVDCLYHDCHPAISQKALAAIQDQPLLPFFEKTYFEKKKNDRLFYIECTEDRALSLPFQRFMQKREHCLTFSLASGHAPFYAKPRELADVLIRVLDEL